jgi:hypothetical protein
MKRKLTLEKQFIPSYAAFILKDVPVNSSEENFPDAIDIDLNLIQDDYIKYCLLLDISAAILSASCLPSYLDFKKKIINFVWEHIDISNMSNFYHYLTYARLLDQGDFLDQAAAKDILHQMNYDLALDEVVDCVDKPWLLSLVCQAHIKFNSDGFQRTQIELLRAIERIQLKQLDLLLELKIEKKEQIIFDYLIDKVIKLILIDKNAAQSMYFYELARIASTDLMQTPRILARIHATEWKWYVIGQDKIKIKTKSANSLMIEFLKVVEF